MKLKMTSTNRLIVAVIAVIGLGVAFWMLTLGPKREESKLLGKEVEQAEATLAQHRTEVSEALEARKEFSSDYRQLVVLGKAVPGDDDSASLLVQLNRIGQRAGARFKNFELDSGAVTEEEVPPPAPEAGVESAATGTPVSPTEAAAATMPLGASIGPAGLAVMPYTLAFDGSFFEIADFIKGLDSLVSTKNENVTVNGRLMTVDGFTLSASPNASFPALEASFAVTTYLVPPTQGLTAGASPIAPAPATATPASTSIGAAP